MKSKNQKIKLEIRVQPKSSQHRLEKIDETHYKAYLKAAPENNKANDELLVLLAEEFGLKRYQMEILKGLTNRNKVVRIDQ